jgi:hypothetical protein
MGAIWPKLKVVAGEGRTVREWYYSREKRDEPTTCGKKPSLIMILKCIDGVPDSVAFHQESYNGVPAKPPRITLKGEELAFFLAVFQLMNREHRIMDDMVNDTGEVEVDLESFRGEEADGKEVPKSDIQREGG